MLRPWLVVYPNKEKSICRSLSLACMLRPWLVVYPNKEREEKLTPLKLVGKEEIGKGTGGPKPKRWRTRGAGDCQKMAEESYRKKTGLGNQSRVEEPRAREDKRVQGELRSDAKARDTRPSEKRGLSANCARRGRLSGSVAEEVRDARRGGQPQ